jgi:hypothetical protein
MICFNLQHMLWASKRYSELGSSLDKLAGNLQVYRQWVYAGHIYPILLCLSTMNICMNALYENTTLLVLGQIRGGEP